MKSKKPGKDSTSEDSGEKQSDEERKIKKKKQWFHDSSQTESEALRAIIGKQKKEDENPKESEKDNEEQ